MTVEDRNPSGEHEGFDQVNGSTVRARQGFLGKPVLMVLVVSLALTAIVGVMIGLIPL